LEELTNERAKRPEIKKRTTHRISSALKTGEEAYPSGNGKKKKKACNPIHRLAERKESNFKEREKKKKKKRGF